MQPRNHGVWFWVLSFFIVSLWLLPILGVLLTSIKPLEEIHLGQLWTWPGQIAWGNYSRAFVEAGMGSALLNSLLITLPAVLGALAFSLVNGYVLAKCPIKGGSFITKVFLSGMFLPFQVLMIPVYLLSVYGLGLYDSHLGVILFHIAFQIGFGSFFMKRFIAEIPDSIIDAGRMDGASEARILWSFVFPLSWPALSALGVLIFTWVWNDYLWSAVLLQSDHLKPVTTSLQNLQGQWSTAYHLQAAGAVMAALPPTLLFLILQKHFVRGLTMGGEKS